jgi:hypothetical protein
MRGNMTDRGKTKTKKQKVSFCSSALLSAFNILFFPQTNLSMFSRFSSSFVKGEGG